MPSGNDSTREVERLQAQILELESQVKKFLAGELNQYRLQARLDHERKTQSDLLTLSDRIHRSHDEKEIARIVAEALVEDFDFERSLVCTVRKSGAEPTVIALEGYYESESRGTAIKLASKLVEQLRGRDESLEVIRDGLDPGLGMDECVVIPCRSGMGEILGYIIFGTSKEGSAYHRTVDPQERNLWESIDRVTSLALENARLYEQLARERESLRRARDNLRRLISQLELIVEERTRKLRESEEKYRELYNDASRTSELYRTLLDASPDPIVVYDIEGHPTYINPAFTRVFGWTFDEVKGKKIDFVPEANWPETKEMIELVEKGVGFSNRETRRLTKDGRIIDVSISGSIFFDDQGKTAGSVVHLRDITERKVMEEELLKISKLESVGLLAGGIAHDFNNIMASILMNAQLAVGTLGNPDRTRKYLTGIEEATQRATSLTQQLLTFSKGGAPVKRTASIARLIKESVAFTLRGSNVRSEFHLPDDLWPVEVDEGQMNQVIQNLVLNADQAMPEGGVIRVRGENMVVTRETSGPNLPLDPGRHVKISIEDEGIGIPHDHLPRIFDPYFTTKQKGSGLGLTVTFSIITKHRGYITAESVVGGGTTFHFYLPCSKNDAVETSADTMPSELPRGKGRILLMDDEDSIRTLSKELLESAGYEVATAGDGSVAVEMFEAAMASGSPFDLVIMDLTVPGGLGGKEAIASLLKIDPSVKAIVSSGYANDPVMADFAAYGFKGVVAKPYGADQLLDAVRNVLGMSGDPSG